MGKFVSVIAALLLILTLVGCSDQKIFSTLAIDRSQSNVNNSINRKTVMGICKLVVSQMRDIDTLTIKEFDSQPKPAIFDVFLRNPIKKKRDKFSEDSCPKILAAQARKDALPGTDIRRPWAEFYKEYEERKKERVGSNKNSQNNTIEICIIYVDALEDVSQPIEDIPNLSDFKSSLQKFIEDGNFVLVFVANDKYREFLGYELNSINNQKKRLALVDAKEDYHAIIKDTYMRAMSKDSQ